MVNFLLKRKNPSLFIEDELKIFIGFVSGKQKEKTMKGFQEVEAEQ